MSIRELFMGTLFTFFGMYISCLFVRNNLNAIDAKSWPSVEGEIVTAEVIHTKGKNYKPNFFYTYAVNGVTYINSRMTYGSQGGKIDVVNKVMEAYPLFSKVRVYYKPNDPDISVVEPGYTHSWIKLLVPITFFFIGLYILISNINKYKNERHS
jgi:hypothetical protein